MDQKCAMPTTQEVFEAIYRDKLWGGRKRFWRRFYSGSGSIGSSIVKPYIEAIAPHIANRSIVDIGCGDFFIGKQLVPLAARYIACDIARPLIEFNRKKFSGATLEFHILDAAEDQLPDGDIVIIRQVLQHLDNASVSKVTAKLSKYRMAIITEHVPADKFIANLDMPTGTGNRTSIHSGLVLSEPPFSLPVGETICEVSQHGGLIRTNLHRF